MGSLRTCAAAAKSCHVSPAGRHFTKRSVYQSVRPGQRLPAPSHVTQRKPLASQAILLQANDWTFLYDLEGQLQFPIEAAVTSLRPDVVLFSRSSKTIVLLELTVPLEDNVHLAHDRKTSKYSALVTACEDAYVRFGSWMSWLLPSLLPQLLRSPRPAKVESPSDQIRGVKNRPSLIVCAFSSQRHADLGVPSCSLLNPAHVVPYFSLFFFVFFFVFCLHLLCHFRFPPFALRDNSFRFQAYTQQPLAFRFLQLSDVNRTQCVLQFFARFLQE